MERARRFALTCLFGGLVIFGLGCPLSGPLLYDPCPDAEVRIESVPTSAVCIDGRAYGETPLDVHLSLGEHDITLNAPGFATHATSLALNGGGRHMLEVQLVSGADGPPAAVDALARSIGLSTANLAVPELMRGGTPTDAILPLWPSGRVRADGLSTFAIEVDETWAGAGTVTFRVDGELLAEVGFDPETLTSVMPLPAAVLRAARPGTVVNWTIAVRGTTTPGLSRTFEVVSCPTAGAHLARIDGSRLMACQPREVRALLAVHALLALDLDSEALTRASHACRAHPTSVELHRTLLEALRRTGNERSGLWASAWHGVGACAEPTPSRREM